MILDGTSKAIELAVSHAREGKLQLVFSHVYPEVLLKKNTKSVLKTVIFQENVRCVVVDEAHLVDDW